MNIPVRIIHEWDEDEDPGLEDDLVPLHILFPDSQMARLARPLFIKGPDHE